MFESFIGTLKNFNGNMLQRICVQIPLLVSKKLFWSIKNSWTKRKVKSNWILFQYLNLRFGGKARTCASLLYSLQMVLYMGIVVYAPSLALEALTGLSRSLSIVLVGAVCMFYCTLGGMKAVIWTDVFQVQNNSI